MRIALVHDYLTQRGGAERVVLTMLKAFPDAPLYTAVYDPAGTFPEFADHDIRPLWPNRLPVLRRNHRLGLPLYARAFGGLRIDADVVLCSSSGWAHGVRTTGRKVVYCYTPARWVYQTDVYVREMPRLLQVAARAATPPLRRWDRRAAAGADQYVVSARVVRDRVRATYGRDALILPPPHTIGPDGVREQVRGLEPGFLLVVSRLLPYKNVDAVVRAMDQLPGQRLVVVGSGPDAARLRTMAGPTVTFIERVPDAQLRWLYANAAALVAASYEDYGLTPLEAAAFGTPAAVLRFGGFLDTVREDVTGVFFEEPTPLAVAAAVRRLLADLLDEDVVRDHAAQYDEERFIARLREIVAEAEST